MEGLGCNVLLKSGCSVERLVSIVDAVGAGWIDIKPCRCFENGVRLLLL